ncbi:hemerythrin domain-containing protein [Saccharibacillus sp. CPCC 101409]|uniref:hemerythrin domain-containing protein n=1 Tax=Saccharibacillus sp. CPCC 101409 TaxID=3058041 RepID=UPI002673076D|nr:hemerythrin domain-containing protein [Saccharibacillus sp. CPCC 101409]MDO3412352.1 hemerythrin domain-containing protein [Saccharibacillus sp. CPCC 101409]
MELTFDKPATRLLENEHRYLAYLAEEWHELVLMLEEETDLRTARIVMSTLREKLERFSLPLKKHTDKEEAHFFPVLGGYIGFEQGPLVGIEEEHREIEAYIGHFLHHTEGDPEEFSLEAIRKAARDAGEAFEVLTVNRFKEETVLFPMAEERILPKQMRKLYENMNTMIV